MGNIFNPSTAVAKTDNTRTTFDVGKFFGGINTPTPQSVNRPPSNFSSTATSSNINSYFESIAKQESNNNYMAKGQMITSKGSSHYGTRALGKYQFMPQTLKGLGYNVSPEDFLKNKNMQEEAMRKLTMQNARGLGITDFNNLNRRQVEALSMAHYGGLKKARQYLSSGVDNSMLKTQTTTGTNHPSQLSYAAQVADSMNMSKSGSLSKALNIYNKFIKNKEEI